MTRYALLAMLFAATAATPSPAAGEEEAGCVQAVSAMRIRAATLPADDLTRRFAETELTNALAELAAGDAEECEEMVETAATLIETRPYALRPGEVLNGYGPDGPLLGTAAR